MLKRQTKIMSLMGKLLKIEMGMTVVIPILNPAVGRCVDGRSRVNPTRRSVCPKKYLHKNDNHESFYISRPRTYRI